MSRADDEPFCANPRCALHVRPGSPAVRGRGEWATLPDGRTYARTRHGDRYYCHVCSDALPDPPGVAPLTPDADRR